MLLKKTADIVMLPRMKNEPLSPAKRRLLDVMKRATPLTARELAERLGLTDVAVRQHLDSLAAADLVRAETQAAKGRGRPSSVWRLTPLSEKLFPDRHGELTVGLITAIKHALGEDGLEKVVEARAADQIDEYRALIPGASASLKARVQALAEQRTAEGYMAEVREERRGEYLLVEHHCPICDAAKTCTGLCSAELHVFQESLGERTEVERVAHLLSGDQRCVYRIRKQRA